MDFVVKSLSHVQLFVTPQAHKAVLFIEFPMQEYKSRLPFPSPGDLSNPGINPASPALAGGFFITETPGKHSLIRYRSIKLKLSSDSLCKVLDITSRGHGGVFVNVMCICAFLRFCRVPI